MVRPARVSDNDIIKLTLHDHVWHYEQHAHCLPSTYYTSDERSKMSVKNNFSIYYGTLMQSHRPNGKGRPWQRAAPRRIRHLPPTMRRRRGRGEPQCASALQQLLSALHSQQANSPSSQASSDDHRTGFPYQTKFPYTLAPDALHHKSHNFSLSNGSH